MTNITLSPDGMILTVSSNMMTVAFDGTSLTISGGPFNLTNITQLQADNATLTSKITAANLDLQKVLADLK